MSPCLVEGMPVGVSKNIQKKGISNQPCTRTNKVGKFRWRAWCGKFCWPTSYDEHLGASCQPPDADLCIPAWLRGGHACWSAKKYTKEGHVKSALHQNKKSRQIPMESLVWEILLAPQAMMNNQITSMTGKGAQQDSTLLNKQEQQRSTKTSLP